MPTNSSRKCEDGHRRRVAPPDGDVGGRPVRRTPDEQDRGGAHNERDAPRGPGLRGHAMRILVPMPEALTLISQVVISQDQWQDLGKHRRQEGGRPGR